MSIFDNIIAQNSIQETEQAQSGATYNHIAELEKAAEKFWNDPEIDQGGADIRFSTSLNLNKVRNALVAVIGAGGLGNWQWRILLAMGFRRVAIFDDDKVGLENVGSQCHSIFDIDKPKVQACDEAALAYRGIHLYAMNQRVSTMSDIISALGEVPDIVIGCTDSAEFRNGFIEDLASKSSKYAQSFVPELFIDYRMSLGDWVAYIVPARALLMAEMYEDRYRFYQWYEGVAVFPPAAAVQEPCTERAIAYTGANVASFTGAIMHWFYSGGNMNLSDSEYLKKFVQGENEGNILRSVSFSARDFEFISETPREKKLSQKIAKAVKEKDSIYADILRGFERLWDSEVLDIVSENVAESMRGKYIGHLAWFYTQGKMGIIGPDVVYDIDLERLDRGDGAVTITGLTHIINRPLIVLDVRESFADLKKIYVMLNNLGFIFNIYYPEDESEPSYFIILDKFGLRKLEIESSLRIDPGVLTIDDPDAEIILTDMEFEELALKLHTHIISIPDWLMNKITRDSGPETNNASNNANVDMGELLSYSEMESGMVVAFSPEDDEQFTVLEVTDRIYLEDNAGEQFSTALSQRFYKVA